MNNLDRELDYALLGTGPIAREDVLGWIGNFEDWSADPRLKETRERALEWGKAHSDFSWKMLQGIANSKRRK